MKENTRTWLLAIGAASLAAFAGLAYHLYPEIVAETGLDINDLGGVVVALLVMWLVLHKKQSMTIQARIVLAVAVGVGLLVGLAVFFIS